ncbi:MAG TPA: hypothetical protein PLP17_04550, partial [Oligoflexia bacterium]|nr:hypothetical protein [Oligoflexia bacterium]
VLQKSAQKSSMSRFLDRDAVTGALGQLAEELPPPRPAAPEPAPAQPALRVLERPAVEIKETPPVRAKKPAPVQTLIRGGELYLTPRSAQILNELVSTFKEHTNRAVAPTHMLRGLLLAIQSHLPEVRKEIAALGPLKRPANESQFALDREEFEKKLGEAIIRGVK